MTSVNGRCVILASSKLMTDVESYLRMGTGIHMQVMKVINHRTITVQVVH